MSYWHESLVKRVELFDIAPTKWAACKAALKSIAAHANESEQGLSWPGVELMMLETGMSESTVCRATDVLAKAGWITKKRRNSTSNIYRINVAKLQANQVEREAPPATHMAKFLPDLLFPGENIDQLTAHEKPKVRGRSTARERLARKPVKLSTDDDPRGLRQFEGNAGQDGCADQEPAGREGLRQIDVSAGGGPENPSRFTSNRRERSRQIDDLIGSRKEISLPPSSLNANAALGEAEDGRSDESPNPEQNLGGSESPPKVMPASWAMALIADLDFGRHRRPTAVQAHRLARLVEAASCEGMLTEAEVLRHCRAAISEAKTSAVVYLRGALQPDRLPVPVPRRSTNVLPFTGPAGQPEAPPVPVDGVAVPEYQKWRAEMDSKKPHLAKASRGARNA